MLFPLPPTKMDAVGIASDYSKTTTTKYMENAQQNLLHSIQIPITLWFQSMRCFRQTLLCIIVMGWSQIAII